MRIHPSLPGFSDLYALITLYHCLKNPETHADLSGRVTSVVSPADVERVQFWQLEVAIDAMSLAILAGKPAEGLEAVQRVMNATTGSEDYRIILAIWRSDK